MIIELNPDFSVNYEMLTMRNKPILKNNKKQVVIMFTVIFHKLYTIT